MTRRPLIAVAPPLLIALCVVLDVATRFLPLDWFAFRAWEVVTSHRAPTGPFRASTRLELELSSGDLAALANAPAHRQYRRERFTTDAWGFRTDGKARGPALGVVVGDSFVAGAGLSDDETLPAQLGERLGGQFLNAGGHPVPRWPDVERLRARLGLDGGLVLTVVTEKSDVPSAGFEGRPAFADVAAEATDAQAVWAERLEQLGTSRLQIAARRALSLLAPLEPAGQALPPGGPVWSGALPRLGTMLFLRPGPAPTQEALAHQADALAWFSSQATRAGARSLVLLVPSKATVYGPLLVPPAPEDPRAAVDRALADALRARGVAVVELHEPLRRAAADALARGRTLYWLDDTHWNAAGVAVAVDAVQAWLAAP